MTDVVYVLGPGSQWRDRELFYSMRSVLMFLRGKGRVFVVGQAPRFVVSPGLPWTHIRVNDVSECGACNINHCLLEACLDDRVSDTFLRVDDDCFFLREQEAGEIHDYQRGTLPEHIKSWQDKKGTAYCRSLAVTQDWLRERDLPLVDFEVHGPMLFRKEALGSLLMDLDPAVGYLSRSLYGNYLRLPGRHLPDCKIDTRVALAEIERRVAGRPFFSLGDGGLSHPMWYFLDRLLTGQRIC